MLLKIVLIAVVFFRVINIVFLVTFGDYTHRTDSRRYSAAEKQDVTIVTRGETRSIINREHSIGFRY